MTPTQPQERLHLSVVVPVYRSQHCLEALVREVNRVLAPTGFTYEVILVNDFSPDASWQVIEELCRQFPFVTGVDLRRNFGQDNAILTGMRLARGQWIAVMDDDLQHDPKYLPELVAKAEQGYDAVFADFANKQQKRWKNLGSWLHSKIAEWVLYKPKGLYLSPYKVIRREVADAMCRYQGPTPYIDGLLLQVTWRLATIPAEHHARFKGEGNYGFWRSAGVSARLLFSFSVRPARALVWIGLSTSLVALLAGLGVTAYRLLAPQDFPPESVGWASTIVIILMMGGLQMLVSGILGEYVGRTYLRVSEKPQTSIRELRGAGIPQSAWPEESAHERLHPL